MSGLAALCLDLFLIGHAHLAEGGAGDGAAFERRVRGHLNRLGLPNGAGFRVFGRKSVSGLYHQIDEQTDCGDALVIGEWKAYRGQIPKNDLLRFKAATDDYWIASASGLKSTPVVRVFGGTGTVSEAMRVYAAQWGIVLVTPHLWPVPAICDQGLLWAASGLAGPCRTDRRTLASLVRPLSLILRPEADGSWRIPPVPQAADLRSRLTVWRHWSERAWECWDDFGRGCFDRLVGERLKYFRIAA